MTDTFLAKVEPYILSDDKSLRDFALHSLHNAHLGTEHTFFYCLEALDKLEPHPMINHIIPFTRHMPLTENILEEVIKRLNKEDANMNWYQMIISRADIDLIAKYQNELSPYLKKEALEIIVNLHSMTTDQLFKEAGSIMNSLADEFNSTLFDFGKKIFKELIKRGEYDEPNHWEIEAALKEEPNDDFVSYNGIYNVFLAGEQKVSRLIPLLSDFLKREEEDFLLREVTDALIKMNTTEVIPAIEKYLLNDNLSLYALSILGNIKHPTAVEKLLHYYDQTIDKTWKLFLAEALSYQLAPDAIPKVETLIEEGYDTSILDLTEPLYANCVMNGIEHPKLAEWKKQLLEKEAREEEQRKEKAVQDAKRTNIGRNDPCPCGSGKKFKKCCGK